MQQSESTHEARSIIVTYDMDPGHEAASIPVMAYKLSSALAGLSQATIIAHARDRAALQGWFPSDQVVFAGSAGLSRLCRRVGRTLFPTRWNIISMFELPDHVVFDLHAFLKARQLVRRRRIDYALRINPVSFRVPSLLSHLRVPAFTGPHNGGMEWPPGFRYLEHEEHTGSKPRVLGDLLHRLYRDAPRYAGIFVAHEWCAQTVPADARHLTVLVPENAVDGVQPASPHAGDATRLLYVGRLTAFKSVDVAIRALARLPESVTLTVVGDGPQAGELQQLARDLGVADRCRFTGLVPHAQLGDHYGAAGVFVFPSVRESGGAVVLEAMAHGLPCIVADWGGPQLYAARGGLRLSVDSPQALEDDLVDKVQLLLAQPELGRALGEDGRASVDGDYVWRSKAARMHEEMLARARSRARA